jgi:hypothetical protein
VLIILEAEEAGAICLFTFEQSRALAALTAAAYWTAGELASGPFVSTNSISKVAE